MTQRTFERLTIGNTIFWCAVIIAAGILSRVLR